MKRHYETALITGATGMTGAALVRHFCASGMTVYALGRDQALLDSLAAETGCLPLVADLADTHAVAARVSGLPIDLLINNAGSGRPGAMLGDVGEGIDQQVDVNLRAVMHLTLLLAPGMLSRNHGHIVIISSIAGHHTFPGNAAYHASKAGAAMFARQLRVDLAGKKVRVTEISPGRIRTDMFAKALGIDAAEAASRFFDGYEPLLPGDIVDAVDYVVGAPLHVNISNMEIVPTAQVPGGMQMTRAE